VCVIQQSSVTGQSSSEYSRKTLSLMEVLFYCIIYMFPVTNIWCGEGGTSTWHARNTGNLNKGSGQEVPTNIGNISADHIVSNPSKHYSLWSPP